MRGALLVVVVVAIVGFILDALSNGCVRRSVEGAAVVFAHHFIFAFALLGWLFDDPGVLMIWLPLPFIIQLHWRTSPRCFADEVATSVCGELTDFNHLAKRFGVPRPFTMGLTALGLVVAAWKLGVITSSGAPPAPGRTMKEWRSLRRERIERERKAALVRAREER